MRSNFQTKVTMGAIKFVLLIFCVAIAHADETLPVLDGKTREVLYREGSPVLLRCGVVGDVGKDVKFSWTKNGKPVVVDNKSVFAPETQIASLIIIESVQQKTSPDGTYHCSAESPLGIATSGPINVKKTFLEVPKVAIQRHTPVEGEPFELDCPEVKAYPKPRITWMYQHGFDKNISHTILDRRITTGPNGKLYFSNVTIDDTNRNFKYVCMASSPAVDNSIPLAEHYIIDLKKNTKTGFQPLVPQFVSKEVVGRVGETTALYCIYGGTPLAFPQWYHNGVDIENTGNDRVTSHNKHSGKRLLIRETRVTDEGTYYCHVTDEQGKNTTNAISVKVVSAPSFVKTPEPKIIVIEGQDVTIPCQVESIPKPTLAWTYNAKPLKTDARITAFAKDNSSELRIKKVQKSDQGYYGCSAYNENGVVYAESLLFVSPK